MGPWKITSDTPDASWCTLDQMSGKGNAIYAMVVNFAQNQTGKARLAQFTITDTDHPSEAHSSWQYLQYATRGDGSLGNAALVKSITSSDGYKAIFDYDEKSRPVSYQLTNPQGGVSSRLTMTYDESGGRLSVSTSSSQMSGTMDRGYQAERLYSASDTAGYFSQVYNNGVQVSANYAFNFMHTQSAKGQQAFSFLLNGQDLSPDSLHCPDSLRYYRKWNADSQKYVEKMRLHYSTNDNRCQSADVNQLLLGFDECNPLLLLSMFRYARATSIISQADDERGRILVRTEHNADKSVKRMTVSDERKNTQIAYDFSY
jgi:hypothetical protein